MDARKEGGASGRLPRHPGPHSLLEALAEADLAIVAALLSATGSTVLGLCMNPVARIVSTMPCPGEGAFFPTRRVAAAV